MRKLKILVILKKGFTGRNFEGRTLRFYFFLFLFFYFFLFYFFFFFLHWEDYLYLYRTLRFIF